MRSRTSLHVYTSAATASDAWREQSRTGLLVLLGMSIAHTALSIVNTLVMSTTERASQLATLRLLGATPRQVLQTALWRPSPPSASAWPSAPSSPGSRYGPCLVSPHEEHHGHPDWVAGG